MEKFGNCSISFTGAWKPNAVAAYTVWRNLPQSALVLAQYLNQGKYRSFLDYLAIEKFRKESKNGLIDAQFGLSRATYVLHVFSRARFPIYDANTQAGIHFLTQGLYGGRKIVRAKTKDPDWYSEVFCSVIRDLQEACAATNLRSKREVDKALFCYGKARKRR